MLFGKIDYLNLLPFHVFLKQSPLPSYFKKSIEFKKGVPSKLCKELANRRVDAAVISAIESRKKRFKTLNMGIVAKKEVLSVLVRKNSPTKKDPASMSSNMLARILDIDGEVIIGDRALYSYINEGKDKFYDLAKIWNTKTNLPFVFAKFCLIKNFDFYNALLCKFIHKNIKIPQYILKFYSKSRKINEINIKYYLKFISYKIERKEQKSLRIFLRKARELNFNPNKEKV